MTPTHHPDASTLMSFAAGTLPAALAAALAAHVSLCPHCRRELRVLEAIGAASLSDLAPAAMPKPGPDALATMADPAASPAPGVAGRQEAERAADPEIPAPLRGLIGRSLDNLPWSFLAPGVREHALRFASPDDGLLRLIKAAPGAAIPEHGHAGMELTLVLRGGYSDAFGAFGRGDMADLDDHAAHTPIADPAEGCICLVASEAHPKFRSVLARLVHPLVRS